MYADKHELMENRAIVTILLVLIVMHGSSQSNSDLEMMKWIEENRIMFNHPSPPDGFVIQFDCENRAMYRRDVGDTIFLYSWGGSYTIDLEELKVLSAKPAFNVYYIPIKVQSNGTLIMHMMHLSVFLSRNDTLYLYDSFNELKEKAKMQVIELHWGNLITEEEMNRRIDEIENEKDDFIPGFKAIYFEGIFDSDVSYTFNMRENFKSEQVHLLSRYKVNNKVFFEINLITWTNGKMRFSEDFEVLETTLCDTY